MMKSGGGRTGKEIPYVTLMNRGGYEVREYPNDLEVISTGYTRRDEAFNALATMWKEGVRGGGRGTNRQLLRWGMTGGRL